jgi:hypothetical protein
MQFIRFQAAVVSIALAAAVGTACSSQSVPQEPDTYTPPAPNRDAGQASDSTAIDGNTLDSAIVVSREVCASYIKCAEAATPGAAGAAVAQFGSASNCWKGTAAEAKICEKSCVEGTLQLGASSRLAACNYAACTSTTESFAFTRTCDACLRTQTMDRCCAERAKCAEGTACNTFAELTWARCGNDRYFGNNLYPHARELSACLDQYNSTSPAAYADFKALQACVSDCQNTCTRRR